MKVVHILKFLSILLIVSAVSLVVLFSISISSVEASTCEPNTYYVDATNGLDTNDGTCSDKAWKTLAKVNSSSFSPGNTIKFKRGEVWHEQLTIPSSGTVGNPITFTSYGTGEKPIINGADLITGIWTNQGNNVWSASLATDPSEIRFNEVAGQEQGSIAELNSDREWYHDAASNTVYVYSGSNPGTRFSTIEYPVRQYGIYGPDVYVGSGLPRVGKSYIVIDGFVLKRFTKQLDSRAVEFDSGSNVVIRNCDISEVYYAENPNYPSSTSWESQKGSGIYLQDVHNALIYNNTVRDIGNTGIMIAASRVRIVGGEISNNEITNFNVGIRLGLISDNSDNGIDTVTIHDNYVHDFDKYYYATPWHRDGFQSYTRLIGGDENTMSIRDVELYNNYFENNGVAGSGTAWVYLSGDCYRFNIHHNIFPEGPGYAIRTAYGGEHASYHKIHNNVFWNQDIRIALSSHVAIKNNIFVDNGSISQPYINIGDAFSQTGLDIDYNLIGDGKDNGYIATIETPVATYYKFATWQALGFDTHSIQFADPKFIGNPATDPSNKNVYVLQNNSPAINAGTSLGYSTDLGGNTIPRGSAPDIGAYEYPSPADTTPPSAPTGLAVQ